VVIRSCASITHLCRGLSACTLLHLSTLPVVAQPISATMAGSSHTIIASLIAGSALVAAFCAIALVYGRKKSLNWEVAAHRDVHALAQRLALSEMLNRFDEQVVLFWEKPSALPVDLTREAPARLKGVPADVKKIMNFSEWLEPVSAAELGHRLRMFSSQGDVFMQGVQTVAGKTLEVGARHTPSGPMLRFRPLSELREQSVKHADQLAKATRELETLRAVLNEIPVPIWIRNTAGQLAWVNKSYAQLVEAKDPQTVVSQGYELLDATSRQRAIETLSTQGAWQSQILSVTGGKRRNLQILARTNGAVEAGCAIDAVDADFTNREVERVTEAHQRTLDHLHTAVATFGADRKLLYHNPAWDALWQLDPAFLADAPEEGFILDRLREARKLPEQADYKSWKAQHLESYASLEPREVWWHLPDGRTLRVFTLPNPQGGITLVQENVTEVLDLKSRAAASERMQRETLDGLTDAVAVFGLDGRLKLTNPALLKLWHLEPAFVAANPHINEVIAKGMMRYANARVWAEIKQSVIAFGEERKTLTHQLELNDGQVVDLACVPLPDGATLITFVDVTASVNVERVLKERNEALEAATRLKNDFIQHMSYELRSPLTNIIGFTQLLEDPNVGPLNIRQREYMGYIGSSSATLLALINDILDLATIDAGAMELDIASVDILEAMNGAVEALGDRLSEKSVTVNIEADRKIGSFNADGRRVRQALYNVLSNAVNFSEPGQSVLFRVERNTDEIIFTVFDNGTGIAQEDLAHIFERFESRGKKGGQRGIGLGLSIVKSVLELHGGSIQVTSSRGMGTEARLVFPLYMVKAGQQSAA
jgi:signal transduction histidine kinase